MTRSMTFDSVHDVQQAFRKLVDAMSRPGLVADLKAQADKLDPDGPCRPSTLLMAIMLLDPEVTFHVHSRREAEAAELFRGLTNARTAPADEADFVFVLRDAADDRLDEAIRQAKSGDLIDPHLSATLIVEAETVAAGDDLRLTGPGIDGETGVRIGTGGGWLAARAEKNREYPMGIDMIFVDSEHRAVCLPRTTQIAAREGRQWVMSR